MECTENCVLCSLLKEKLKVKNKQIHELEDVLKSMLELRMITLMEGKNASSSL